MATTDETTTTPEPNLMFEQALVPLQEGLVSFQAPLASPDDTPLYVRVSARERDIEALKTFAESLRIEVTAEPRLSDDVREKVDIDAWVADALLGSPEDTVFLIEAPVAREQGGMRYSMIAYPNIGSGQTQHWTNGRRSGSVRITVSIGKVQLQGNVKSYTRPYEGSSTSPWATTNGTCWTRGRSNDTSRYTISDGWHQASALVDDQPD